MPSLVDGVPCCGLVACAGVGDEFDGIVRRVGRLDHFRDDGHGVRPGDAEVGAVAHAD